ncbi:MAG: C-GCAxxG-C-C family protein [Clostridia bacterium]|nr:C-GCAxxG-C-C family protein [Clostridia bacterium]
MSKHKERASEIRKEDTTSKNCAQTILRTFADETGLDEKLAAGLAAHFGGGMRHGGICGAVSAALMVLGASGVESPSAATELMRRFKERNNGLIACRDLLAANAAAGGNKHEHCNARINDAIEILDDILERSRA